MAAGGFLDPLACRRFVTAPRPIAFMVTPPRRPAAHSGADSGTSRTISRIADADISTGRRPAHARSADIVHRDDPRSASLLGAEGSVRGTAGTPGMESGHERTAGRRGG